MLPSRRCVDHCWKTLLRRSTVCPRSQALCHAALPDVLGAPCGERISHEGVTRPAASYCCWLVVGAAKCRDPEIEDVAALAMAVHSLLTSPAPRLNRSEERRVGKEGR